MSAKNTAKTPLIEMVAQSNAHFKNDKIIGFSEHELPHDFIIEEFWHDSTSVPVDKIVGTQHPDYIGLTWEELLHKGKRMHINLPLAEENPDYYYSDVKKLPTMSYNKLGDNYYVAGDGNHRSVIAKFLFFFSDHKYLDEVSVYEYDIDWIGFNAIERLSESISKKSLPITLKTVRELVSREDGSGWKRDTYKTTVRLYNHATDSELVFSDIAYTNADEIAQLTDAVENRSWFSQWFSSNPYAKFVG